MVVIDYSEVRELGIGDWSLEYINGTVVDNTLTLIYDIGKEKDVSQLGVTLQEVINGTCASTSTNSTAIQVSKSITVQPNSTYDQVAVGLTYDLPLMKETPFYSVDTDNNGLLKLCARLDVYLDSAQDLSVSFDETIVNLEFIMTVGLTGFSTSMDLEKAVAAEVDATSGSTVYAYICDSDDKQIISPSYGQNSGIRVCVKPEEGYIVKGFIDVDFLQGGVSKSTIVNSDGTPFNVLTELTSGSLGVISTRLTSDLFDSDDPLPLEISGKVNVDVDAYRALETTRLLSEDSNPNFAVYVELVPNKSFDPLFVAACGVLFFVLCYLVKSNRNQPNQRYVAVQLDA